MLRKIKYITVMIVTVCLLNPVPASAVVFLGIPAAYLYASAALHAAGAAIGVYFAMKPSGVSSMGSDGKVSRPSSVTWVDLSGPTPTVVEKNVTASKTFDQAKTAITSKPSDYPLLTSKLSIVSGGPYSIDLAATGSGVGKTVVGGANAYYLDSKFAGPYTNQCVGASDPYPIQFYSNRIILISGSGSGSCTNTVTQYLWHSVSTPVPSVTPSTPAQFTAAVAPSGIATAAYQAELDKAMQDDSYIPVFTDDTTGLPFISPSQSTVATPAQISAINSKAEIAEKSAASVAAASAAESSAQSAYNADPSAANLQTLNNAKAASAATSLKAAQDTAASDTALADEASANALESSATPNAYDTEFEKPEKKGITSLLESFVSSSPLVGLVRSFSISSSSPVSSVSAGQVYGTEINFSFVRWEPYLRLCGAAMIIIAHGFAVFVVVRGW